MSSNDPAFPTTLQLVEKVPLIKSPSFWVSKPIELPPDIHPLPEDVQAYFVYPHTIEAHALSALPAALDKLHRAHEARCHLLASYAESKERARKARLNQIAPGWSEGGQVMQPSRKETRLDVAVASDSNFATTGTTESHTQQVNAASGSLDDFVAGLEKLDSSLGSSARASKEADEDLI
ncbi:hypothetical protein OIV83_001981 [Microbotryomycetes sp. JL201]|nr:hypothetical protein OIV83_001981 [Microbotryomycetes sp. JL201]